ncbi:MAG: hypothetical protein AB7S26_37000 [Sandaracinaceae bacterium]
MFGSDDPPPAPETPPPPPVEPEPVPTPATDPPAQTGGFTIPGLPGLTIPLPQPNGQATPVEREPPARGSLPAVPPGSYDANGFMTRQFLDAEAEAIHQALLAALDERERQQVGQIPLSIVIEHEEPNAAAACIRQGGTTEARMMITSAMLELCAGIAEAKAYDEIAGTHTYEDYVTTVVDLIRRGQPVRGVEASVHPGPHNVDPHKLARQRHLFEQQVSFILGHELAHHYLGHTNCVSGRSDAQIERDEMSSVLAHTIPPFEQPREVEADMWGTVDAMEAGRERPEGTWTEEGALLNLDFFRRLTDRGGEEILLAFLSTHPPSIVRMPIVQSTAQQWTPGWRPPRMPVPGETTNNPLGIPIPTNLPIDPSQLPIPLPFPPRQQ